MTFQQGPVCIQDLLLLALMRTCCNPYRPFTKQRLAQQTALLCNLWIERHIKFYIPGDPGSRRAGAQLKKTIRISLALRCDYDAM